MANQFELEFKHFNESILKNTPPMLTSEDALWNVKTLEGLQLSIENSSWINL